MQKKRIPEMKVWCLLSTVVKGKSKFIPAFLSVMLHATNMCMTVGM
jgi:hypothetical protein